MAFLAQPELPDTFEPYRTFREHLGFVPGILRAQSLLSRAIEAEAAIAGAFLIAPGALARARKEEILLAVSRANGSSYCVTAHAHVLTSLGAASERIESIVAGRHGGELPAAEAALIDFSVRLARQPTSIDRAAFERLRALGLRDEEILEAILTTALTDFLCTLAIGLGVAPDFEAVPVAAPEMVPASHVERPGGPYLRAVERRPEEFAPFAFFRKSFGFVPKIFQAQTLKPEALEAEAQAIRDVLLTEDVLTRKQKEYILLAISAANLNTYCVAVHCEMLRALGVSSDESDQIAVDHRRSSLSDADKALLDTALLLTRRPADYGAGDLETLRAHGFSEAQILESIVMASMTAFLNTLQMGLGTTPDFRPRRDFLAEHAAAMARRAETIADPDAPLVARAREGDMGAFEALVIKHQARIYRTLAGLTGNAEDAEDCCQAAFVKAYRRIADFAGASRFSTWLTQIAINEGLDRLRRRHTTESLDDGPEADLDFRPSNVGPWVEDPERLYAREEMRRIVRQELARLPVRYRTAVMLRDIEQLSTAEAAAALDVPIPTLKTRLLRGRLMMREALAAHFAARPREARPA
jgi:RNA polymerase sigma-70 factor (ECF subfamily)